MLMTSAAYFNPPHVYLSESVRNQKIGINIVYISLLTPLLFQLIFGVMVLFTSHRLWFNEDNSLVFHKKCILKLF